MFEMECCPLRVLHVEDDDAYAGLVQMTLGKLTAVRPEIVHVERLDAALERLSEESFDAILLDLTLPDSHKGIGTFTAVHSAAPDLPIVVLTGEDAEPFLAETIAAGADDYLVKGRVDSSALMRSLRFAVERHRHQWMPESRLPSAGETASAGVEASIAEFPSSSPSAGAVRSPLGATAVLEDSAADRPLGTEKRPVRLLHVEDNPGDAYFLRESLSDAPGVVFQITHLDRLKAVLARLDEQAFDVVLLDLSLPDSRGLETCVEIRRRVPDVAIVVHTGSEDESLAVRAIRNGAQDFLVKGRVNGDGLVRAIRFAIQRQGRTRSVTLTVPPDVTADPPAHSTLVPGWRKDRRVAGARRETNRRRNDRYPLVKSLVAVPVGPDGRLDWPNRFFGMTTDLSQAGIGFELAAGSRPATETLLLGVEQADGALCYAGVEVRHVRQESSERVRLGGRFAGLADEILRPENLTPRFDPHAMRFGLARSEEVLQSWVATGVLRRVFLDWVQLCPKCHGLPTFRHGCRSCGSARIQCDRLIHHFACAHVGFVKDFEVAEGLVCPKCRSRRLVIGADFEYQTGPHRCLDCHWSDAELEQIAQCLRCNFRFAGRQAAHQELMGYDANRLDPLALIAGADELLSFLWGLLLVDGLRYTFAKVVMVGCDMAADAWRRLARRPAEPAYRYCPSVAVILAGYNEAETIEQTLRSVWGTYPRLEIIVVDDGSMDGMAAIARRFARDHSGVLVLGRPERGGKSSAMNFALQYAQAEIVVVIDADSDVGDAAIWKVVEPLKDPRVGAVAGTVIGRHPFTNLVTWLQGYEYLSNIFVGRMLAARLDILGIVSGAFGAFRRQAIDQAMGWDVGPPEDLDLTLTIRKLGYRVTCAPYAICYTDLPTTWRGLFRQRLRWDQSGVIRNHCRKHIDMACLWSANFRPLDMILVLESWFTNIVCLAGIWFWIVWFCLFSGAGAGKLFLTLYFCYLALEFVQALTVLFYSESRWRDALVCAVFPLVPLYQLFLMVERTWALLRETFWRSSFDDNYVPLRVRQATWRW